MGDLNHPDPVPGAYAEWGYPGEVEMIDQRPLYAGGDHMAATSGSSVMSQPDSDEKMVGTTGPSDVFLEGQQFTKGDLPR